MKFLDEAKVYIASGAGGNGCIAFRREQFIEFGGPSGGDGGRGGDVVIEAVNGLNTLIDYRYQQHFTAQSGGPGMGKDRHGANGKSIVLERQPGADVAGYSGLEDEVDNHWGMLFKAAMLSTLLSVGSEAGTGSNENSLVQALRQGASQSFNQTGQQIVGRYLNIQPTLTIRPGFPVRVIVNRDLVLEPYQG